MGGPDENAHNVFTAAVDQGGTGAALHDFEAATLEGKTLRGEIPNGRGEIDLTGKPGLDGVLVGGEDVGEVSGLERA